MRNLSIGRRLALGFAVLLVLSLGGIAVAAWKLISLTDESRALTEVPLRKERLISDWYRNIHSGAKRTSAIAKSSDPSLTAFFAADQAESSKSSNELRDKIEVLLDGAEEKALYQAIGAARSAYVATRERISKAKAKADETTANALLTETFAPQTAAYLSAVQALLEFQRHSIDEKAAEIDRIGHASVVLLLALGGVSLAAGICLAYVLTASITKPLKTALDAARSVAEGNFKIRHEGTHTDEPGQLLAELTQMAGSLSNMISTIVAVADSIRTATNEIAAGNHDLAGRTELASANLQETASAMLKLRDTVTDSGLSASRANTLTGATSGLATEGGAVVDELVTSMTAIADSSRQVQAITAVIDGIAFQTNILALNAAVEAARAGSQGRGFAVVASEVRGLAKRSSEAAREIKELIEGSTRRVEHGSRMAGLAGTKMGAIVSSIKEVTTLIEDIASRSTAQVADTQFISDAVSRLDSATQQNAALVEQSSAAAESLRDQAAKLNSSVSVFLI